MSLRFLTLSPSKARHRTRSGRSREGDDDLDAGERLDRSRTFDRRCGWFHPQPFTSDGSMDRGTGADKMWARGPRSPGRLAIWPTAALVIIVGLSAAAPPAGGVGSLAPSVRTASVSTDAASSSVTDASGTFVGPSIAALPPTNLTLGPHNTTMATLTWTQSRSAAVTGNTVYLYGGLTGGSLLASYPTPTAVTSYTLTALTPGASYSASVAARNASGLSAPSSPVDWLSVNTVSYTESTIHLSGFDPMVGMLYTHQNGTAGQIPTLSSSAVQPAGIYYVTNASQLVYYDLATAAVNTVANVTVLYQRFGQYQGMLENEFSLEAGFDVAVFFGSLTNGSTGPYYIETVNVSGGGVTMEAGWGLDRANQQYDYIGYGNTLVFSSNGSVVDVNTFNHTCARVGTVAFFEANNVYLLPQLHQFIDVEAEGSSHDRVAQYRYAFAANGSVSWIPLFTTTALRTAPYVVNAVDGLGYNATWRNGEAAIAYYVNAAASSDTAYTYTVGLNASGELNWSNSVVSASRGTAGVDPGGHLFPSSSFGGQRYDYTSNYVFDVPLPTTEPYSDIQTLYDPWNQTFETAIGGPFFTAFALDPAAGPGDGGYQGTYDASSRYVIDYGASYLLDGGGPPYRIVYATASPGTYPGHETSLPPSPTGVAATATSEAAATVRWIQASGGGIVNDTIRLFLGPACGGTSTAYSTQGARVSYRLSGLSPLTNYSVEVTAWNWSGESLPSSCANFTTMRPVTVSTSGGGSDVWWFALVAVPPLALVLLYIGRRRWNWFGDSRAPPKRRR